MDAAGDPPPPRRSPKKSKPGCPLPPLAVRPPADDAVASLGPPADGVLRFDVSVIKEAGEGYGLAHVSVEDGSSTLMIAALAGSGPVARWNGAQPKAADERTVRRGDRILAVGGVFDDLEAMKRELRRKAAAVLTLERWPDVIVVALAKRSPTDEYGFSTQRLQREDGAVVLRVAQVGEGLMSEWNRAACQSRRFHEFVMPSFDILRLDELSGDPEKMQEALMTRHSVELTIRRPDPNVLHD